MQKSQLGQTHPPNPEQKQMTSQLQDQRLFRVREALLTVGYDGRAIVSDYDFAVPGEHRASGKVDLAAFSDPVRHDLHTSCIAAERVTGQANIQATLKKLSYLAPPVALILQPDGVDIWPVTSTLSVQPIEHVSYDALTQYFAGHVRDFSPNAISAAKTKGHQASFFDLDRTLLEFAYEATRKILVERFESAVRAARETHDASGKPDTGGHTKAVLQILAAAILEDKQLLGVGQSSTVEDLIRRSASRYGQYFDLDSIQRIGRNVAQVTFEALRQNVTFRSFTNEMLGYFYENAFVGEDLRRELGIYYTPRPIAKRILSRLPVEDIPPSDRVVFDGSSGSGNLLLAAFERIGDLVPRGWNRDQKHAYLVERVHGMDLDQFAAQVAGLSLFFMDLPAGDTWNIKAADFTSSRLPNLPRPPTILVGNPPFKESRSLEGARHQQATLFLSKYLDLLEPEGLLGVILPETFLENSSCRDVRRRLLKECEILELSHLPEGIFPMSRVATVIVLAKKHAAMRHNLPVPVRVEKVSGLGGEKEQFLNGDRPRFSYVVPSTTQWVGERDGRVSSSPLERSVWRVICAPRQLKDVASIRNGIILGKDQRETHIHYARRGPESRPWLGGARCLEPYAFKRGQPEYVTYPGNLQWPRLELEAVFTSPRSKVLMNSARAPGNPWRIYAAIDEYGYFPSQNLHCVMPKDESVSLEELVAVLNSSVANAWVDSLNRKRWIDEGILRDMPFPVFTDFMRESIIAGVREVMAVKRRELVGSSKRYPKASTIRELVKSIDDLVCDAFAVGDDGREMLGKYFAGYRRPGLEWNGYIQPIVEGTVAPNGRHWPVTGQVLQVDAENDVLTLWVRGYNEEQPLQAGIPESMPGWALRQGVTFQAEIPWESREWEQLIVSEVTNFRPLDFSYTSTEELVALLKDPMKLDELYGV